MITRSEKIFSVLLPILAFLGFADSFYLTLIHYRSDLLKCSILSGCNEVLGSRYASVGPVPTALLGAVYYLTLFVIGVAYLDRRKSGLLRLAARLTLVGFVASIFFVSLQVFVLRAICEFCLLSSFTSTLLFISGFFVLKGGVRNRLRQSG